MSKNSAAEAELVRLYDLGIKCKMHDVAVTEMNKKDLIAFIGFLDELATDRELELRKSKKQGDYGEE